MTFRPIGNGLVVMIAAAIGLIAGGAAVALIEGGGTRAETEEIVRNYILDHPEILPEAMKRLQSREVAARVGDYRGALQRPFAGAWAGAANPTATLVIFTDYGCGYCRASVADVDRLLAEDKGLKVVWREIPILGPGSETAARAALAAAQQGRYGLFHRRMFAAGPPDDALVARVSREAGIASAAEAALDDEIAANVRLARNLGITGTPTFVIGNQMFQGAVGYDALKQAVAAARRRS